LSKGRNASR